MHQRGDLVETSSGDLWLCTTGGTPGTWRKLAGPATTLAVTTVDTTARCQINTSLATDLVVDVVGYYR